MNICVVDASNTVEFDYYGVPLPGLWDAASLDLPDNVLPVLQRQTKIEDLDMCDLRKIWDAWNCETGLVTWGGNIYELRWGDEEYLTDTIKMEVYLQ